MTHSGRRLLISTDARFPSHRGGYNCIPAVRRITTGEQAPKAHGARAAAAAQKHGGDVRKRLCVWSAPGRSGGHSDHAETIAKRVAAKCDGRARITFEFLLAFRASVHCLCQERFKIVDVKVNMNWRPVSLISTNFVSSLGWFASSRFLDQSDLGVPTLEDDVCRYGSSDLRKSQGVAIKSQAFVKQRNVN